ncbi:MAG: polymer-forming cytoskeletal protein [Gemmobacter sp.]|nr:polymer-forming cytoskeletal protein [Gemmobacter sp.]
MFTKSQDDRGAAPSHGGRYDSPGRAGAASVLSSDLTVTGIIATEGSLEVHGVVDGEVAAATLMIGLEGAVSGKVQAGHAELRGKLSGEIACDALTLRASARMTADATCGILVIESGAEVEGRFSRPAPVAPPPPLPTPAPKPAPAPQAEAAKPVQDGGIA